MLHDETLPRLFSALWIIGRTFTGDVFVTDRIKVSLFGDSESFNVSERFFTNKFFESGLA
jgi:hypothetical protein